MFRWLRAAWPFACQRNPHLELNHVNVIVSVHRFRLLGAPLHLLKDCTSRARPLCKPLSTSSHQLSKVAANCCQSCAAAADAVARASRHDHDEPDNTRCLAPWVCSTRALSGSGWVRPRSIGTHARLPRSAQSARSAPARSFRSPPAHAPHPFLANRGAGASVCPPNRKRLPTARTDAPGIIT